MILIKILLQASFFGLKAYQWILEGVSAMYHLSDFGSFHVGGRIVKVRDQPNRKVWFTETSYHDQDPNGEFLIEQVYVQYFIPQKRQ